MVGQPTIKEVQRLEKAAEEFVEIVKQMNTNGCDEAEYKKRERKLDREIQKIKQKYGY